MTLAERDVLEYLGAQTEAISQDKPYPEPDLATIIAMRDQQFEKFNRFHKQCERVEEFYRQTISVPVAEGGQMVILPTAHTLIETFADHIDTDHVQIDVRSGPRGQAAAEIRAKFFSAVLAHSEQEKSLLSTAAKHLAAYGVAVLKRFHDADRWPTRPEVPREDAPENEWSEFSEQLDEFSKIHDIENPISDEVINPQQCVWDLARGKKRWVIERYKMEPEAVKKWFPDYSIRGTSQIEVTEYSDDQWCAVLADNEWLMRPRWHGVDHLRYVVIEPAMGLDSMDAPPEERYVGIITPGIQELLIEESRLVSQYDTIVRATSWPILAFQGPSELVQLAKDKWDTHPGAKNVLPDGVTLVKIDPTVTFPEILEVRRIIAEYVEHDTLPKVVQGVEPKQRTSGFEVTARAGMARLKLRSAAKALAAAVQELNVIAAKILENVIREPITVFAQMPQGLVEQRVRPKDIAGQYASKVTLEAASPEDRVNRSMLGMQLGERGYASELMVRRDYVGQTNALEDMMQTRAEAMFKSEMFQQMMMQLAGDAFATFMAQQAQMAESTGVETGKKVGNQFGGGAQAAFATTSVPDQARRSQQIVEKRMPGGMQDIDKMMGQFGKIGAGNLPTTTGKTIGPSGRVF